MQRFGTLYCFVLLCAGLRLDAAPDELLQAIRQNDLTLVSELLSSGAQVNAADKRGNTALHYASVAGSTEAVQLLLKAGADVQARNLIGATPLILAASSPNKVALLLGAGSDVNAATKVGRSALIIAAGCPGSAQPVRALLKAGAKIEAADERGITPFLEAVLHGDSETVGVLVRAGANKKLSDKAGNTALMAAAGPHDAARVRMLLKSGVDVNAANTIAGQVKFGPIALTKMTALIIASPHGSAATLKPLLAAGARVNDRDDRGMTPLSAAVASETQDQRVIKALLAAGADANASDGHGESVLDWAEKFGYPSTISLLKSAGAKGKTVTGAVPSRFSAPASPREAVTQAVNLLTRSSAEFFKQSGCVGCHHQPMTARATAAAQTAGLHLSDAGNPMTSMAVSRPLEPALLQFTDPGGGIFNVGHMLLGFSAGEQQANSLTDAAVNYIAGRQQKDGSWVAYGIARAPFQDGNLSRTALAVRTLRVYGWPARATEFDARVAKARHWLLQQKPSTSCQRADQLLGLKWSGANESELGRAASALLKEQRSDGGWGPNPHLPSDAYATGLALYALHESGRVGAHESAYERGVQFLLRTQLEDGSWYVRSRAPKFQPYFQSGFPHEHDQWISATATAYAVMALAPAMQDRVVSARR